MSLQSPVTPEDHFIGNIHAPIVLVEYADFQCPHSAIASAVMESLIYEFKESLCFVFRHFPVLKLHPNAGVAAVAAEAANLQGKFWQMHHALFENYNELNGETILELAHNIPLEMRHFLYDIERTDMAERVQRDYESGLKSGVFDTPAIFLNDVYFDGVPAYDDIAAAIDSILSDQQLYL